MRLHYSALSHITSTPHMHASHMCADKHLLIAGKTVPTQWTCTCVVSRWSNNAQITTQVNGLDNGYRVARPRLQLPETVSTISREGSGAHFQCTAALVHFYPRRALHAS